MNTLIKKAFLLIAEKLNMTLDNSLFDKNIEEIQMTNLRFLRQLALIGGLLMIVLFAGEYVHHGLIINHNMYFGFLMLSAIIFALTYIAFRPLMPYSTVLLYFFMLIFAAFAAVVGIIEPASGTSALFMIVTAMIPLQIIDKQTHVIPFTLAIWIAFCAASVALKEHNSAVADIISSTLAMIFGILSNRYIFKARITAINNNRILSRSTEIDTITGLPNYKKFGDDMSGKNNSQVAQSLCSLAIFDIDMFQEYNKKYGRAAGDRCLKKIGTCLLRISEPGELIIYRYSGTGFAAVSLVHDYQGIERVTRGILALIRGLGIEYSDSPEGIVTLSAGYTDVVECECDEFDKLIEMATKAMEKSKRHGGNRYTGWLET